MVRFKPKSFAQPDLLKTIQPDPPPVGNLRKTGPGKLGRVVPGATFSERHPGQRTLSDCKKITIAL